MRVYSLLLFFFTGCFAPKQDTFNSKELISSNGEKIYINTINWGITDDNQLTVISKSANRLKDIEDSTNSIKGLDPFIYKFEGDTLELIFQNNITYFVQENFETIQIKYVVLEAKQFNALRKMAFEDYLYHSAPAHKKSNYMNDMPMPPAEN